MEYLADAITVKTFLNEINTFSHPGKLENN